MHALAARRRRPHDGRVREQRRLLRQDLERPVLLFDQVPFVRGDQQPSTCVQDADHDLLVLRRESFRRLDHHDGHVRALDRRASRGRSCSTPRRSRASAVASRRCRRTGRVRPATPARASTLSRVVPASSNTTERSSPTNALKIDDLPTFGRPTRANFGSGCAPRPRRPRSRSLGKQLHQPVEQVAGAAAVEGRDGNGLAEPERVEGGHLGLLALGVDLVRDEQHRNGGATEASASDASSSVTPACASTISRIRSASAAARSAWSATSDFDAARDARVPAGVDQGEAPVAPRCSRPRPGRA